MNKSLFALIAIIILFVMLDSYGYNWEIKDAPEKVCVKFPVINDTYTGRVIDVCTRIVSGDGSIFININGTRIDEYLSQTEIKRAADFAYNLSGRNRSCDDVMIYIESGGTIIRGNSMGAAVCAAIYGAIEGYEMREDIAITGTVRDGGKIGNVSKVPEKANASMNYGMKTIIVPVGKRYYNGTDVGQTIGIEVIEAENIFEAMRYLAR